MAISASAQEIAGAAAYEDLHVPALFRQWAPRLIAAAAITPGMQVLDVACGTGVLAREVARQVGNDGRVAGLDAGAGMLAVAARMAPEIEWRQGLAESLPFETGSFDAVVSQFGLMFFSDRTLAIREMLRVLKPGGRLAIAVWESLEKSEAYPDAVNLLDRVGGVEAGDALRAPFVLGDTLELAGLFEVAGVQEVEIATHHGRATFPSVRAMVEADLRGWLPVMGVHLSEDRIERILADAEHVLAQFVTVDGSVEFDAPAHIVTGRCSG
ncbi:MAG: methyltransferase domain-containing protein [Gammaproteobacteria bacterium]|nr:methyltransferase domain-containing protein [Gammaproteobacteria bacterium]